MVLLFFGHNFCFNFYLFILQLLNSFRQPMSQGRKQWTQNEISLLKTLKETFPSKCWKKISNEFTNAGFNRSQYECREKWVNVLDPTINHQPWTPQELSILFKGYEAHSSQWAIIQKQLPRRTQIKIKNQFYSLIRNIIRFVLKHFGDVVGKESQTCNKIHPLVLKNIYDGIQEFSTIGPIIRELLKSMNYKFDKVSFLREIKNNKTIYKQLNDFIVGYAKKRQNQPQPRRVSEPTNNNTPTSNNTPTISQAPIFQNPQFPIQNYCIPSFPQNTMGNQAYYPYIYMGEGVNNNGHNNFFYFP